MACDEYSQEVLGFQVWSRVQVPLHILSLLVSNYFSNSHSFLIVDFTLMEEADSFLALEDDPTSSEVDPTYQDPEGDILILEAILNSEPPPPLPNHGQYMPGGRKELKLCEAKPVEPSINEPPEVELKELPPHLEYAFLEGDNKLPVIIAKDLKDEETALHFLSFLSPQASLALENSSITRVLSHNFVPKILMEERLMNHLPWVSPVHCVPKKGGMTVITNEENELIPTRLVTGWRVCIDYRKLNEATRKDHFPLPFMDQMLERLAGNEYYCFLDGFSGYFQIPIDPKDQEKDKHSHAIPCMMAIFHDMIEKTMEVFMDDFSVFGDSFSTCLAHLEKMLKRCEDTNLSLNWEKSHFMVKEGIVLGHKISKSGLEVDRAKVEVIAKLPHPTSVKDVVFLGQEALDHSQSLADRVPTGGYYGANKHSQKKSIDSGYSIGPNLYKDAHDFVQPVETFWAFRFYGAVPRQQREQDNILVAVDYFGQKWV
ncbi:reverse transcriptase domain-containing protein [Tanacetum coccineum]